MDPHFCKWQASLTYPFYSPWNPYMPVCTETALESTKFGGDLFEGCI